MTNAETIDRRFQLLVAPSLFKAMKRAVLSKRQYRRWRGKDRTNRRRALLTSGT